MRRVTNCAGANGGRRVTAVHAAWPLMVLVSLLSATVGCKGSVEFRGAFDGGAGDPDLGQDTTVADQGGGGDVAATCGNGQLDPTEQCDGDCPTECEAADLCTEATLVGAAQTCDAVCTFAEITACGPLDGCCPDGCPEDADADCNPVCGNGVAEGPETCDGDCPTECTAADACQEAALVGTSEACDARCELTDITVCTNGDGCCPGACNSLNDDDCAPACGNDVVEGGERCDGNCPATCTPANACTVSTLVGSAATCDASCSNTTITACTGGDGCCPPTCTLADDSDCTAVCGNGVVESTETCDGNCPSSCTPSAVCISAVLVGDASTCDVGCQEAPIVACADGDGCCPNGCNANTDDDCLPMCGNNVLESPELCDGNCPTSCTPPNACTSVALIGSAASCDAECEVTPITACVGGDGCCPAGCNNAMDADCPVSTACTPGDWTNLFSANPVAGSSHTGPVFAAPLSDGGAVVAYHSGGTITLVDVDADGTLRGSSQTTSGTRLYGLAVHDAGRAVLVSRGSDILALVSWNGAGVQQIDQTILGDVPHDVTNNEWFGSLLRAGRITWTGSSWATYNTVQRLWNDGIAHYGDTLRYYDATGTRLSGGWGWGCSHSMEVRISHNGTRTGPVCLSDCYPSKGVHFDHRGEKLYTDPAANCAGGYTTELGASVPTPDGFWVLFAANDLRQSQDIAIAKVDNAANNASGLIWYTDDAVADGEPNAAAYSGTELLVAWTAGGSDMYMRADVSSGASLAAASAHSGGNLNSASDFFTFPNGDVGWAFSAGGSVSLAVMKACP